MTESTTDVSPSVESSDGVYSESTPYYTLDTGANIAWILTSTGFILIMQVGFLFLESGTMTNSHEQTKSVGKQFLSLCLSSISFYLIGYALAFGDPETKHFAGKTHFALN
jgi:Amt family ammonium transporter